MAHECLGEVLRVLRQVINTYPLLNTVEILTAAGKLISKVKGQSTPVATLLYLVVMDGLTFLFKKSSIFMMFLVSFIDF